MGDAARLAPTSTPSIEPSLADVTRPASASNDCARPPGESAAATPIPIAIKTATRPFLGPSMPGSEGIIATGPSPGLNCAQRHYRRVVPDSPLGHGFLKGSGSVSTDPNGR